LIASPPSRLKSQISDSRGRLLFTFGRWALVALGFLLRLAPLGRYVTPDEPVWVWRSIRFADALAARDWAAIPPTNHPGATTMWLGTLGIALHRLFDPAASAAHLEWIRRLAWLSSENGEAFSRLAFFLPWSRVAVALVATLGLAALYPLLTRLLDRRTALLTVGLLACDPFLIGHSGLLHTDALLATFSLLTLAAALNGWREPHRATWWLLSGLFTGLALLTKTPALILLPLVPFLIVVAHLHKPYIPNLKSLIARCSLFALVVLVTCCALYPALWSGPSNVFHTLFAAVKRHASTTQRPIFFAGQTTYDPGPAFYPAVFLFRISPAVLVGLFVGLVTFRRLPSDRRFIFLLLLTFAVAFAAVMSLGVKKHDRYLLSPFLSLTLAAALAWGQLKRSTHNHILPCALLAAQLVLALAFAFRPLAAANPLAGGPRVAGRVISLDWGEGMGAAARRLNRKPNADQLTAATAAVPVFAPIFKGHTVPLDRASLADYAVTASPASLTAAIQANAAPAEQAAYLAARAEPDDLILLDAETPLPRHYTGPGTLISVTDLPTPAAIAARLIQLSAGRSSLWLVSDPAASPITAAHLQMALESIAEPTSSATVASAAITRYTNLRSTAPEPQPPISTFGDQLTLVDALLPAKPVNARAPVSLRWRAPAPTPTNLHASLYLLDAAGHLWAEVGGLVLNEVTFPTSAWAPGEWADDALTLKPPERIPPGVHGVQLIVTDARGAQLGAWDAEGKFLGVRVSLGNVEIEPPAKPAGAAQCAEGRAIAAGPLEACVPALPTQTAPSGDSLTLPLTWSAVAPPRADYSVRWRLLDDAGSVALEQVAALSPYPTSRWREKDSFEARYDLRLEPTLPAAAYSLRFNVLTPDGQPLWTADERLTSVEVLHRERLFDLPDDVGHPLDLTLGDRIHLRGFDLARTEAAPDGSLPLVLYWQGEGPSDVDYTVFVHLVGPDGQLRGQVDRFPDAGAAPTSSWAAGQVVVDQIALPVAADAPTGAYHIAVGMYDAASGGRLPITDRSGQRLPDDQAVLPAEIAIGDQSR